MNEARLKSSIVLRMIVIVLIALFLLIPMAMIRGLIAERRERREAAIAEVAEKWARPQTIVGPILTIPMSKSVRDEAGKESITVERLQILPDSLEIAGVLGTEVRYRGIYEVVLYNSQLTARGSFDLTKISKETWNSVTPLWQDAYLTIGISDLRGIKENVTVKWNSKELNAHGGVLPENAVRSGMTFAPPLDPSIQTYSFDFALNLNGSSELSFAPTGTRTHVSMRSTWPAPSFVGRFLPDRRTVGPDGFSAEWTVLELNRNFPQFWLNDQYEPTRCNFGVSLLLPVDHYQKTNRTTKYAIMIIALTFWALFLSEVLARQLLHPIQYGFIGFALVLFYLLLLSLSEHLGFDRSYLASSLSAWLLVTLYCYAVLSKKRLAVFVGALLLAFYVFFYVLLQLEDYALLIGSLALLVVLAAIMYLTRKVNWFSGSNE